MMLTDRPSARNYRIGTARRTWALLVCSIAFALLQPAFAQAPATLQATVYRALYYDQDNKLLHIEEVDAVAGRTLVPLVSPVPAAPPAPPASGPAVLIGEKARTAVYYGTDPKMQQPPTEGARNIELKPIAIEFLTEKDRSRPIRCASKGGDVCSFPKMCHCPAIAGCCCY